MLLSTLKNPLLINLECTFQDRENLYFVLEYVNKGELASFISAHGNKLNNTETIDKEVIIYLAAYMVLILEYLHSNGVAHRDFKPENLLLNNEGKLKCIDFGTIDIFEKKGVNDELFKKFTNIQKKFSKGANNDLADKFTSESDKRKSFVGTTFYVAPEMILDQDSVTCAADLWALGIILYRLAKNQYLFDESNDYLIFEKIKSSSFELAEDLDSDIKNLIMKLLVKDPSKRLGSGPDGFDMLKKHPFFESVDWENILEMESPLKSKFEINFNK